MRRAAQPSPIQQEFAWPDDGPAAPQSVSDAPPSDCLAENDAVAGESAPAELRPPAGDELPIADPLPQAVAHGVFGMTIEGPIVPDAEAVRMLTVEHARKLRWLLEDIQAVEDATRTGVDPRSGRRPRTEKAAARLEEYLSGAGLRLWGAYTDALAVYAEGFGDEAARTLECWVRAAAGYPERVQGHHYDPAHPWHYYHKGDNAPPVPLEQIEPCPDAARLLEAKLPKNPARRTARLRELLAETRRQFEQDSRRYHELIEHGAEALSRYDREIAHGGDDAMARATALALTYNHVRYLLGLLAWLEGQPGVRP